jgi:hypothetical protein
MKNDLTTLRSTRWTQGALLAATLALGAVACTPMEGAASLWVHGVIAITQQEQCVARADARNMRMKGTLDTWMTNQYVIYLQVENYLLSTRNSFGELYGENHNIQMLGAHLSYQYPDGLDPATVTALSGSHFVPATGDAVPENKGIAFFNGVIPEVGNALAADSKIRKAGVGIVLHARIEGRLGDGTVVRSNEYAFPIDICFGCLYQRVAIDCTDLSDSNDMRPPCIPGQDEGVDCRLATLWNWDPSEIGF